MSDAKTQPRLVTRWAVMQLDVVMGGLPVVHMMDLEHNTQEAAQDLVEALQPARGLRHRVVLVTWSEP